jgi:site-specific recombinase XerD
LDETIRKQFIAWCIGKKMLAPSTAFTYCRQVKELAKEYPNLSQVTHQNIVDYLTKMRIVQEKNENTRRLRKLAIELFYSFYAPLAGMQNPAVGLSKIKAYQSFPKVAHPDEIERMCYYVSRRADDFGRRNAAVIAFLAMTGIRIGEFERVRMGDIERKPDHFVLTVGAQKGTFARQIQFGQLIPGTLVDYFSRYWIWANVEKKQMKTNPLFWKIQYKNKHEENTEKAVMRGTVKYILDKAVYLSGINRKISAHEIRHFYATHSIVEGMNLFTLQRNMGHARITTTQGYVHIAGMLEHDTLKHSPTAKIKSSPDLSGYTELLRGKGKA